jgi:hypothetical protein
LKENETKGETFDQTVEIEDDLPSTTKNDLDHVIYSPKMLNGVHTQYFPLIANHKSEPGINNIINTK